MFSSYVLVCKQAAERYFDQSEVFLSLVDQIPFFRDAKKSMTRRGKRRDKERERTETAREIADAVLNLKFSLALNLQLMNLGQRRKLVG